MTIVIPKKMGYAGGNLKGLHAVLEEIVAAVESSSGSVIGCDATISELNTLHGVVAGTTSASKALVVGASKDVDALRITKNGLNIGGTNVTTTAAELNYLDDSVAGTAVASKALVLGADKDIDTIAIPVSGLKIGAGAGTAVTASAAELNFLKTAVAGTAVPSKAAVLGASKNLDILGLPVSGLKIGAGGAEVVVTTSAAEMNILKGVTAVPADLNKLAATSAGVSAASKAAILGANKNLDILGLPVGGLKIGTAGAEVVVTPSAAELNILKDATVTTAELNILDDVVASVTLAPATSTAHKCLTTITFKDAAGVAIDRLHAFDLYLSDAVTGIGVTGTTCSGAVAAGSSGTVLVDVTAKKYMKCLTSAAGVFVLAVTESSDPAAMYAVVVDPLTGRLFVSTALVWGS
jgi:hypothetical protein